MATIPTTSTTLLRELGNQSDSARWSDFILRYEPMMRAYLQTHFARIEADDVIQETLLAVMHALPQYRYNPEEHGHFHNYLTGILRKRALHACRKRDTNARHLAAFAEDLPQAPLTPQETLLADILEIALQQLLADETLAAQSKQIFIRVAINGESPADVAARFHVTRNNVDQIKSRLTKRLREHIDRLQSLL